METLKLFNPIKVGAITLKNRIAMAPMARFRALGNMPNELMAEYYRQRAGAGLIITEATAPSPNSLAYPRMPGIFNTEQMQAWSKVAAAVHENGGKIIIQLMQTGRIGHTLNMPEGAEILAPSAIRARGSMFTDSHYMQSYQLPRAMNAADIQQAIAEFATAASYAMEAGFDGVELHGANGYMIEQFLSPVSNIRTDQYGGNIENRARFALEAVEAVASAIGKDRTGVRFSPYGMTNDMYPYPEMDATYTYLAEQLNRLDIAFLHITNSFSMGSPDLPLTVKQMIRSAFKNTIIGAGGHTRETAEAEISYGLADLVAFGRPFINNPDLAERYQNNWPLSTNMDVNQIYRPGETGYTDYPVFGH